MKKKLYLQALCFLCCFYFMENHAFASCLVTKLKKNLNFSISLNTWQSSSPHESFIVNGCEIKDIGNYIAISLGPDITPANGIRYNSFNGKIRPFRCEIQNSQLRGLDPFATVAELFKEQDKVMNDCIEAELTARGEYLDVQEEALCKVKRINDRQVKMSGSLCFIAINDELPISISYRINPRCINKNYVSSNIKRSFDINGSSGIFYAKEVMGKRETVSVLSLTNVRMTLESPEELLTLAPSYGFEGARYPTHFVSEIHPGDIIVSTKGNTQSMEVDLFVDNRCAANCNNDFCASACDYRSPIGAEITLNELLPNGKDRPLDMWYQGEVANSRWAGKIFGIPRNWTYELLKQNTKYRLDINVSRPDLAYRAYQSLEKDGYPPIDLRVFEDLIYDTDRQFLPLPIYPDKVEKTKALPVYISMPPISSADLITAYWVEIYSRTISILDELINETSLWPPFYSEYCANINTDNTKVVGARNGDFKCVKPTPEVAVSTKIKIEFELRKTESGMEPYNLKITKDSNTSESYTVFQSEVPHIKCTSAR